ncbi:MAG: hypothetical protein HY906_21165 [Deltaproteobacteria bacterium]|nr:hypothetical protein [Deltaproteobacteria bacterium]
MRRGLLAAVVTTALLGVSAAGCRYGSAPRCASDADCELGRHCIVSAGICVGFDTPLRPAPDAGLDGPPGDGPAPADGAADATGATDAVADAPQGGG